MAHRIPEWGTPEWVQLYIATHGLPPMAGADDNPPDPDPKDDPAPDPKDDHPKDDPKDDDANKIKADDDWKSKARKHETAVKRERREREKLEAELAKLRDKDKSEQEKAIEKAREEAKAEALTEAQKELRADRLEVAVSRHATKGVAVGDGDDAKTVKFADPEDALLRVERQIRRGEIAEEDIYDDEGKVKTDALRDALVEIASANPHLVDGNGAKPTGSPDTRRGDKATSDLESLTPEDHAKRKYPVK